MITLPSQTTILACLKTVCHFLGAKGKLILLLLNDYCFENSHFKNDSYRRLK